MAGRQKSRPSIVTDEALAFNINRVKAKVAALTAGMDEMSMGGGQGLTAPEPRIPFKVFERPDDLGIFITVDAAIPNDTDELRILLIDKRVNTLRDGETEEAGTERARQRVKSFRVPVSETEAANGRITIELKDPFQPRKIGRGDANAEHDNADSRAVQLIRLVALNLSGKQRIPIGKNPDADPFDGMSFPFPALVVRDKYDDDTPIADMQGEDKKYFTISKNIVAINGPSLEKIICNRVIMKTSVNVAEVTFRVNADDTDPTKTFADQNIKQIFLRFRSLGDPATASMEGEEALNTRSLSQEIQDPNATFTLIKGQFLFGEEYQWKAIVYSNGTDKDIISAEDVTFFAGGDGDLSRLVVLSGVTPGNPGVSTDGKLQLQVDKEESDVNHTYLGLRFKQPGMAGAECSPENRAVIFKRLRILEKRQQDASFRVVEKDPALDNNIVFFTPGEEVIAYFKVPQRKRASVLYKGQIVGLDGTMLETVQATVSLLPGLTNDGQPPDPSNAAPGASNTSDLVDNMRDGDSGRAKARLGFRVWSCLAAQQGDTANIKTFRQLKVDKAGVRVRRQRNEDANDPMNLDEPTTRNRWYYAHIPESAQDSTSYIISVHNNHLGDKFIWDRVALGQSEVYMESPGTSSITFFAGYPNSGAYDPTRLTNRTITATRINKRHSKITVGFDQGSAGTPLVPPVFIRRIDLWVKYPDDPVMKRLKGRSLKNLPEYSTNDPALTYPAPNTAFHKEVDFRIPHKDRIPPSQILVQAELKSEGDRSVFIPASPMPITYDTGNDEPSAASTPMVGDIILNTLVGDVSVVKPRLRFRVFASDAARSNASITFASQMIDSLKIVFGELGSSTALTNFTYDLTNEKTANFVDIQVDDFALAHAYSWIKTVASNGGGHTPALSTNLTTSGGTGFVAGGRIGTAGLPELGMISFTRTEIDERHSKFLIGFTQPNPPILLRRAVLNIQVISSPNGFSEASFHREDVERLLERLELQLFTGTPMQIELTAKHPRRAQISAQALLIGVSEGANPPTRTLTSAGINTQDMMLSPPSPVPTPPSFGNIVLNTLGFGAKALKNRTALRIFASFLQNQTFAQVGADAAYVVIARSGDPNSRRIRAGGPIRDLTALSIDIEVPGLEVGGLYDWLECITSRNGVVASNTALPGAVTFYAGNVAIVPLSTAFTSGLSTSDFAISALVLKNPRFSTLRVSLRQPGTNAPFQPNTANRLPVLIGGITVEAQEGAMAFDKIKERELLFNQAIQQAGTTITSFNIHHKKNITMTYRITLTGVDGSILQIFSSESIPNSGEFDDEGLPGNLPGFINCRWNQRGLRINFPLALSNMNTHTRCAIILGLIGNGQPNFYLWSATARTTQDITGQGNPSIYPTQFPGFIEEVGKQGHVNFNVPAGVQDSIDPNNTPLFNRLNNNGGSLTVYVYIYNKFMVDALGNPLPQSFSFVGQASFNITAGFNVANS